MLWIKLRIAFDFGNFGYILCRNPSPAKLGSDYLGC